MSEKELPAGTQMFFGVPTKPMPEIMADAIGQVIAQVPGIREAYLPQCFIQGDTEARQVLVVGVDNGREIPRIMDELMGKMRLVLPANRFIDILPFPLSAMPGSARVAECRIYGSKPKPWWKVW
jgi:SseB protein C-terminal domain